MKKLLCLVVVLFTFLSTIHSQKKTEISGRVVDSKSVPVAGVGIFIDGSQSGKITDKNGIFRVKVGPDAKYIRILSPTGIMLEMEIDRHNENIFVLDGEKPDASAESSEETINIGYGTVEKRNKTDQVSKLDNSKKKTTYSNIYEMIATQPGVTVSGKNILVRGINSINDNQPLIVLDGIAVQNIDDISPESVQSIEILKGSYTAAYGSRGANGVILITLRKK